MRLILEDQRSCFASHHAEAQREWIVCNFGNVEDSVTILTSRKIHHPLAIDLMREW